MVSVAGDQFGSKLSRVLINTSRTVFGKLMDTGARKVFVTQELLDAMSISLVSSDISMNVVSSMISKLEANFLHKRVTSHEIKGVIFSSISDIITPLIRPIDIWHGRPLCVVILCGLNGAGKTTTIGKMSYMLNKHRFKTVVAVCDTTRKAATDQLRLFTNRLDMSIVAQESENEKPTSIVKRAMQVAVGEGAGVLLIDTPGYHPEHLDSIRDVRMTTDLARSIAPDGAQFNVVAAIDASGGQNAVSTIKDLSVLLGLTGMVITKMDVAQRAGIVVSACYDLQIPVHGVGVGLGVEDLQDFSAKEFLDGLSGGIQFS